MSPRWQSLIRLLGVQAAWTYERMAGIGVGHAAAPLLRDLYRNSAPAERRAAVARSAEYFNSHPYLAGVAVGAVVHAEREGVPGPVISRLRTALSGPLGALGDQLIWAGEVPAVMGLALASVPLIGWWAVLAVVVVHNVWRVGLTLWGLDLGLREGLKVGAALERSWLPRAAGEAQRIAAFGVGLGVPIAVGWLLDRASSRTVGMTLVTALVGVVLLTAPATRTRVTGVRLGLGLVVVALMIIGGMQ
jgi:mannose/fructose/N-acetylgalactosamine-specific phosphotransferase system component IID